MDIDKQQILDLAELVRIEVSDEQTDSFGSDLNEILHYFEKLSEVDTSDAPPTARIFEGDAELREDAARPSLTPDEIGPFSADSWLMKGSQPTGMGCCRESLH